MLINTHVSILYSNCYVVGHTNLVQSQANDLDYLMEKKFTLIIINK